MKLAKLSKLSFLRILIASQRQYKKDRTNASHNEEMLITERFSDIMEIHNWMEIEQIGIDRSIEIELAIMPHSNVNENHGYPVKTQIFGEIVFKGIQHYMKEIQEAKTKNDEKLVTQLEDRMYEFLPITTLITDIKREQPLMLETTSVVIYLIDSEGWKNIRII